MTKFLAKTAKILSAVALFGALNANAFELGKDYTILQNPLDLPKNSLVKVFSYACQYCYKFDKGVTPKVVAALPQIEFEPYHLSTKGPFGESTSKLLAVMLVKDRAAKTDIFDDKSLFKKTKFAIYKAVHDKKTEFSSKDEFIDNALKATGMNKAAYENALNMPEVQSLLKTWEDGYEVAKLQGIPVFLVGGKYVVYPQHLGSVDNFIELVKELSAK